MSPDVGLVLMWAVVLALGVTLTTLSVRKRFPPWSVAVQAAVTFLAFTHLLDALDALPPP